MFVILHHTDFVIEPIFFWGLSSNGLSGEKSVTVLGEIALKLLLRCEF
jgi:hypothetical protein